jgi:hypothetical protein
MSCADDSWASVGRYAFIATTEAPNPTLAAIARREERYQTEDDEWRKRKRQAAF